MIWIPGAAELSPPRHNRADVIPIQTRGGGEGEDPSNVEIKLARIKEREERRNIRAQRGHNGLINCRQTDTLSGFNKT